MYSELLISGDSNERMTLSLVNLETGHHPVIYLQIFKLKVFLHQVPFSLASTGKVEYQNIVAPDYCHENIETEAFSFVFNF